jgi:anti-sigma B factor antagonist
MEDSTDKGLRRDAAGDHLADLADHRLLRTNLDGQAGTRVEPTPALFEVRRVDHPLGVVLTLGGELDLATVPLLQEQLDRAMRGRRAVVVDLSGLRFIDSSGLHMLMRAERQLHATGGRLGLVYGSRAVRRVFELTGLDRYFAWFDSPSAALRTALEPRNGSRAIPQPAASRQTAAELDRELGGVMWS